jgi:hypothetical protein
MRRANLRDKIGREVMVGDTVVDTGLRVEWKGVVRHPHFTVGEDGRDIYLLVAGNEEVGDRIYLEDGDNRRLAPQLLVIGSN